MTNQQQGDGLTRTVFFLLNVQSTKNDLFNNNICSLLLFPFSLYMLQRKQTFYRWKPSETDCYKAETQHSSFHKRWHFDHFGKIRFIYFFTWFIISPLALVLPRVSVIQVNEYTRKVILYYNKHINMNLWCELHQLINQNYEVCSTGTLKWQSFISTWSDTALIFSDVFCRCKY